MWYKAQLKDKKVEVDMELKEIKEEQNKLVQASK